MEVVLATSNPGKVKEFKRLIVGLDVNIRPLGDFPDIPPVIEDGVTFEENASKKAREVAAWTGLFTIADDSGLSVDCLDGRPGVLSARFAGDGASDDENNSKLMAELAQVPPDERAASFICVLALADPEGNVETVRGECRGSIALSPKGRGGFGYDPFFYLDEFGCTMAEVSPEIKNRISHRGKATRQMMEILPRFLNL